MLQEAKDLQEKAVEVLLKVLPTKKIVTFKAPTGAGKTFMMALLMDKIIARNSNVVFLVSCLSKAKLAKQNYEKFRNYLEHGFVKNINPYLLSDAVDNSKNSQGGAYIPTSENVYVLANDLYKDKSILYREKTLLKFFKELTENKGKEIYLIRDESHIATNKLNDLALFYSKEINISATPKGKADVEISEADAVATKIIKSVEYRSSNEYKNEEFTIGCSQYNELKSALDLFKKTKRQYSKFNINPCMIIQISNTEQGVNQLNVIKNLLEDASYKDLHWISVACTDKSSALKASLCDTNDQLIKSSPEKWEKYAVQDTSLIDIVIFKMKLTEGWDMPRANMLFQVRNTQSDTLDCQLVGRVRRNPKLLDFENYTDPSDRKLLTTAYVWGIRAENQGDQNTSVDVVLKGNIPDDILSVKNEIQEELKLNVTKLLDKILTEKSKFSVSNFLANQPKSTSNKNIFDLYDEFRATTNKVQSECYRFIEQNIDDPYTAYFAYVNNLKTITSKVCDILTDYKSSIEVVKNSLNQNLEVSLPYYSLYVKNPSCRQTVKNTVWKTSDPLGNFDFDSQAEAKWLNNMLSDFKIKKIPLSDDSEVYLIGKNYPPQSDIRYEYYNKDGRHFSYPDFVMKNTKDEYFLFEVKSVNTSSNQNIDSQDYLQKVEALKDFYCAVSSKVNHYFCLPILNGNDWNINVFFKGEGYNLDYSTLKDVVNGVQTLGGN